MAELPDFSFIGNPKIEIPKGIVTITPYPALIREGIMAQAMRFFHDNRPQVDQIEYSTRRIQICLEANDFTSYMVNKGSFRHKAWWQSLQLSSHYQPISDLESVLFYINVKKLSQSPTIGSLTDFHREFMQTWYGETARFVIRSFPERSSQAHLENMFPFIVSGAGLFTPIKRSRRIWLATAGYFLATITRDQIPGATHTEEKLLSQVPSTNLFDFQLD